MRKLFILLTVVLIVFVISVDAHSELFDRGCGLIYDDVLDITLTQDARLVRPDNPPTDPNPLGSPNAWGVGFIGWFDAVDWADALEYPDSCRDLLWNDWRLPSAYNYDEPKPATAVGGNPCIGFNCTKGEMGYLYYVALGNTSAGGLVNTCFTDGTTGEERCFENMGSYAYWYGEPPDTYPFWFFSFYNGYQGIADCHIGWAVRDGDVGLSVLIDILPGIEPNILNPSSNLTPVAILSSDFFDAADVSPATITLLGVGVKLMPQTGVYRCRIEDANSDGLQDLICKFPTAELILAINGLGDLRVSEGAAAVPDETVAVLEGETFEATPVRGWDTVSIGSGEGQLKQLLFKDKIKKTKKTKNRK